MSSQHMYDDEWISWSKLKNLLHVLIWIYLHGPEVCISLAETKLYSTVHVDAYARITTLHEHSTIISLRLIHLLCTGNSEENCKTFRLEPA